MLSLLLSSKTKTIVKRAFQILILINFHEPLKMEYNIQRPSSSELPLPPTSYLYIVKSQTVARLA